MIAVGTWTKTGPGSKHKIFLILKYVSYMRNSLWYLTDQWVIIKAYILYPHECVSPERSKAMTLC